MSSKNFILAKKDADNLEHHWDTSEAKLRKIDSTSWTKIDGTIDVVLAAARTSTPDANKCKTAINQSLNIINAANN